MKEYTRTLACGNKEVQISANTKAEIRSATRDEKEIFRKKHWDFPNEPPCQINMWKSMCETLNNLLSYTFPIRDVNRPDIWGLFQKSLGCSIYEFKFIPADDANKENVIQIAPDRILKYPQDFLPLADALESTSIKATDRSISEYSGEDESVQFAIDIFQRNKKEKQANRKSIRRFFVYKQKEIKSFRAYAHAYNKITEKEDYKAFCESYPRVLDVDGEIFFEFENDCGFDIEKKLEEIEKIKKKIADSDDPGEKDVEYAISWFRDTYGEHYMVPIKHDCESKHRYNCILLCKPDFRDEPQKYDHILVCASGVVLIETKNWEGIVEIRPDGQLVRRTSDEKSVYGEAETLFQVQRHEALIKKILPEAPICNILCLSNKSVIIDGKENAKGYSVMTIAQLKESLLELCSADTYSKEEIDRMAAEIEANKARNANLK